MRILVLGAGGHGQVVVDILRENRESGGHQQVLGYLDDSPDLQGKDVLGIPVLGKFDRLGEIDHEAVVVAVGDNRRRAQLFETLISAGENVVNALHPTVVVAEGARLGRGIVACARAVINTGALIGDNTIINTGANIGHHSRVAPHNHIGPGSYLGGYAQTGEGAQIGIRAVVIPSRRVGAWSVVGAGSTVIQDVPWMATVLGVPARVVFRRNGRAAYREGLRNVG